MPDAYSEAMDIIGMPWVFDVAFHEMVIAQGLEAALTTVAAQQDLKDDERDAVRVTLEGVRGVGLT